MNFSVLISVYNLESPEFFKESLASIQQQSLRADEVVIVEDGPLSPALHTVINDFRSSLNIKSVVMKHNVGLAQALNAGLQCCENELVMRMDSDDVCVDGRFEKQVNFMTENPSVAACSGQVEEWDESLKTLFSVRRVPLSYSEIKSFSKRSNPINHPACILRKKSVLAVGGYPLVYPEDIYLWAYLLNAGYELRNLPDVLVKMRAGMSMINRRGLKTLRGEVGYYRYILSIGMINYLEFFAVVCVRSIVRLSPGVIRAFMYRNFR